MWILSFQSDLQKFLNLINSATIQNRYRKNINCGTDVQLACFKQSPSNPINLATLAACSSWMPCSGSTGSLIMLSGASRATSSMLTPPWELANITGPYRKITRINYSTSKYNSSLSQSLTAYLSRANPTIWVQHFKSSKIWTRNMISKTSVWANANKSQLVQINTLLNLSPGYQKLLT